MDLGLSLNLEQTQKLIMTPKLQLAIELLQFSSQDLAEYVEEELESNPLLEKDEDENNIDERLANQYSQSNNYVNYNSDKENDYENYVSYKPNMLEHLEKQLYLVLEDSEMEIGNYILGNIDEDGFLTLSTEEISKHFNLAKKKVNNILKRIQYLDPKGIAARNPRESLLIQLDSLALNTELAEVLVANYYDLITEKKYGKIIKDYNAKKERIKGALNLIKTLRLKPAAGFNEKENTQYIVPDIIIRKVKGKFVVIMNEKASPVLRINPQYYRMLQKSSEGDTYEFLHKKFKSALWLIKSIEQRRITVYRIAESIISKQEEFLNRGIKYLKPMTMQEIADSINMHESTVSRATSEKYVQTPQGLFELKFFFTSGINNISSVSIKTMIIEYIENEDKSSPLSDSSIARKLEKEEDINVSRRTVAKYRNELGLKSSVKRKKRI